jgi:hypothetical protein
VYYNGGLVDVGKDILAILKLTRQTRRLRPALLPSVVALRVSVRLVDAWLLCLNNKTDLMG